MRTRDVLRWHWSVGDLAHLTLIVAAGLALGVVDRVAMGLESWIDRRAARVEDKGEVRDGQS